MNENSLILFLKKFDIDEEIINTFLKNKKICEINKNVFLVDKDIKIKKNTSFIGDLIFINLVKFLPSKFLLEFIKKNTENNIEILNEKQSLNFTYSKNLLIESLMDYKRKYLKNKFYIVSSKNNILGYSEFVNDGKRFYFENKMNVGDYLKENNNNKTNFNKNNNSNFNNKKYNSKN